MWDSETFTLTINGESTLDCNTEYTNAKRIEVVGNVLNIPDNCFSSYRSLEYLSLPDSVVSLGNNFLASTKLKEFRMPHGVNDIPIDQSFDHCYYIEKFIVDDENAAFTAHNDALYSQDMSILYYYPGGKKNKLLIIPEGVTRIFRAAIAHSKNLEEVIIPTTVTQIDASFAHHADELKRVVVLRNEKEGLSSTISWGKDTYTFLGMEMKYEDVIWMHTCFIPYLSKDGKDLSIIYNPRCNNSNNEYIFNGTLFSGNPQIEHITFDYGLSTIGCLSFNSMTSLKRISFPVTLKNIENGAFDGCSFKKHSCISYPNTILDVLKPHFSRYALGLSNKECLRRSNFNAVVFLMIFIY